MKNIDLKHRSEISIYRSEMARNAIESEFRTSEMARNAIESEFLTSKMAAGSHFVKNFKKKSCISIWNGQKCDRKWILDIQNGRRQQFCQKFQTKIKVAYRSEMAEMRSKVKFGHPKWPTSAILSKISKKIKVAYRCEMDINEIESDFRPTAAIL